MPPSERVIRERLLQEVAQAAAVPVAQVDSREPFASYGLSSLEAVYLVGQLEDWLGMVLPATLLWDHPTIDALASHLAAEVAR
ncbi:MAG: acyl carrier protein [Kofleriaceae bacterium]|jgi:acyl carrier protein|nr:acyl carrier protein [Kofleriaceae bacterium]MBP6841548.1 acyl carrier protein [Kofleriaceae bacterium]MBP9206233.1 acyl carrier protein [Kofleriaceae bacterium]